MSSLTLIGAHRAVSSLLESRPKSWDVVRFKGLFDRLDRRNSDLSYEMLSLRSTGEVVARAEMGGRQEPDESSLPRYLVAEVDDLVVNPMWLIGGGIGVSRRAGAVSPDYRVFRSRGALLPRFIHYLLRSQPYLDQYLLYTRAQTTFDRRVQQPDLDNLPIPVPPLEEQRSIADYLDRATARIDTLIEEQQRLIEMLRERRHSLVDGVFGGHVPNVRLQNACIDVVDCPHTTPEVSEDGEYEAVRTASVRNGEYRPGNGLPVDADTWKARNAAGAPTVGDVLFTREAPAGEACMVPNDRICLGQRMVLLRIDHTVCVGAFLLWQIYSDRVQGHFRLSANGSTVANVRLPVLRTTPIWLPDLTEQRRIAAYLNEQTAKIDNLITETEQFIELSKERRSALITAAVTGQIDVREMA
ncbi:restriction endonuclease subunit S [Micromonospora maris]|uniref:restriction endonuclease subunit S n=1 Tax=Micromonospora maris TaxID=1003110 RepID=UPI002E0EA6A8|nr:restriction endonuclease subunit S [Micromonospora maris]WSK41544.1 restriction endonuclease subunit S [Micromonospora maris]